MFVSIIQKQCILPVTGSCKTSQELGKSSEIEAPQLAVPFKEAPMHADEISFGARRLQPQQEGVADAMPENPPNIPPLGSSPRSPIHGTPSDMRHKYPKKLYGTQILHRTIGSGYSSTMNGSNARQSMHAFEDTTSAGGSTYKRGGAMVTNFLQVATMDSLAGTFIGHTLWPGALARNAGPRERWDHVDEQLDSLVNKEVLGGLFVLPGMSNRLHGGVRRHLSC